MTVANWLTLIGIIVGGIVALQIGYLHRKQMRQIELHRADPKVPLHPPAHTVTRFLKDKWIYMMYLACIIYNVVVVIGYARQTTPPMARDVIDIAFHMVGIIFFVFLWVLLAVMRGAVRAIELVATFKETRWEGNNKESAEGS